MDLTDLNPMVVRDFVEELTRLDIKEVEVPKNIKLPNWPSAAGELRVKLGKRDYLYPTKAKLTGMLKFVKKSHRITFLIR